MKIKELKKIIENKILDELELEELEIIDETNKHIKHANHTLGKYHLKIIIKSIKLLDQNRLKNSKLIFKIIENELKNYIHSIQLKIN